MMVGEFGLNEDKPGALDFLSESLAMFDNITSGWFYWSYDRGSWGLENEEGEELKKTGVLGRPYPMRIAGTQPVYSWQPEQRIFSMSFSSAPSRDHAKPTEIYLPPRAWPEGWELINHGVEISYAYDKSRYILSVEAKRPGEVIFHVT
jgi:hypothetical protein